MKIQVFSDLHLEFFKSKDDILYFLRSLVTDADCVIIAGDVFGYENIEMQMQCIDDVFGLTEVVFIPGNHEYYGTSRAYMNEQMRLEAKKYGMIFLENGYHMLDDNVIVIGACGWHDSFTSDATRFLTDFSTIEELISDPYSSIVWNHESKKFFSDTMEAHSDKKIICVTHNAPLIDLTPHKYIGSVLNPFFANDWSDIIRKYKPSIWISGHFHQYTVFEKFSTMFIENGYGYHNHSEVPAFKRKFIVNVTT